MLASAAAAHMTVFHMVVGGGECLFSSQRMGGEAKKLHSRGLVHTDEAWLEERQDSRMENVKRSESPEQAGSLRSKGRTRVSYGSLQVQWPLTVHAWVAMLTAGCPGPGGHDVVATTTTTTTTTTRRMVRSPGVINGAGFGRPSVDSASYYVVRLFAG